jgi:hypothetical protein
MTATSFGCELASDKVAVAPTLRPLLPPVSIVTLGRARVK